MERKKCSSCQRRLGTDKFGRSNQTKDGLLYSCRECRSARQVEYRKENPDIMKRIQTRSYMKNRKKTIELVNSYNRTRDAGLYIKYWSMIRRCKYPSQVGYRWYGAKGIIVEWKSYDAFRDDMYDGYMRHLRKHGHRQTVIDRRDSSKNYCKSNCRWITATANARKSVRQRRMNLSETKSKAI